MPTQEHRRGEGIVLTQPEADSGRWAVSTALWPLYPREITILLVQEAKWASESLLTAWKFFPPPRDTFPGPSSP